MFKKRTKHFDFIISPCQHKMSSQKYVKVQNVHLSLLTDLFPEPEIKTKTRNDCVRNAGT